MSKTKKKYGRKTDEKKNVFVICPKGLCRTSLVFPLAVVICGLRVDMWWTKRREKFVLK